MSRIESPGWISSRSSGICSIGRSGARGMVGTRHASAPHRGRHRSRREGGADIFQRQVEREGAAHVRRAAQMDFAAEQVRQLAADREAQAGAAVFAAGAGVGLLEGLEDDLLLLGRDADAGVGDLERHHRRRLVEHWMLRAPAALRGRDAEPHAALRGELERVRQQVLQHLLQALGVGGDAAAEIGIEVDLERQLPGLGLVAEGPRDHVEQIGERRSPRPRR